MQEPVRRLLGRLYRSCERVVRESLHLYESEDKLIADSQHYWDGIEKAHVPGNAHWRGQGLFAHDDGRWLLMGQHNYHLYRRLTGATSAARYPARIIDWGCGGGANAVHFAPGATRYYGVDITAASLLECQQQVRQVGVEHFVPIQFDASTPETVLTAITEPCELFFSTYVFELFPSKAYGNRVLDLAYQLLAPGGQAFIQIKYADQTPMSQPHRWGYAQNLPHMVTYRLEEFWANAIRSGFAPQLMTLELEQEVQLGRRYAYYLLTKPA